MCGVLVCACYVLCGCVGWLVCVFSLLLACDVFVLGLHVSAVLCGCACVGLLV